MTHNKVVYRHRRKDTNKVFYVGMGTPERPDSISGRNNHWKNVVNKAGRDVEILAENLSLEDATELEIFLIAEYKEMGVKLVNITDGGEGKSGYIPSKETKTKISQAKLGQKYNIDKNKVHGNLGKLKTKEHKANLSQAKKGIKYGPYTEEHSKNLSTALKGKPKPEGFGAKISATKRNKKLK